MLKFRLITRFVAEMHCTLFAIVPYPHIRNYGPKVLLCTHMAFPHSTTHELVVNLMALGGTI